MRTKIYTLKTQYVFHKLCVCHTHTLTILLTPHPPCASTRAESFQNTTCSSAYCTQPLTVPAVHFLCKHSYHQDCLNDDGECRICAAENQHILSVRAGLGAKPGVHDAFDREMSRAKEGQGFATVAKYFGKGLFAPPVEAADATAGGAGGGAGAASGAHAAGGAARPRGSSYGVYDDEEYYDDDDALLGRGGAGGGGGGAAAAHNDDAARDALLGFGSSRGGGGGGRRSGGGGGAQSGGFTGYY